MSQTPKVFGLAGWSGSGKTTLIKRLLPALIARGFSVSTVKHTHHRFDVDHPGKDSHSHREAGAREVLVSSELRWALMHELRGQLEPDLPALLARMSPVDLILVEGFKQADHDKLEVHRPSLGKAPLWPGDHRIVAVASDAALLDCPLPQLALQDAEALADFVLGHCGLPSRHRK